jgi:hypothetical protein
MNADDHRAKAQSIEQSLARCTVADYETVIEGCMLAGTHWFNIILHGTGIATPQRDAMHAEFLSGADRRKARVLMPAALDALDAIEALRTPFVRGDLDDGERAAQRALACLEQLRRIAQSPAGAPAA